MKKVLIISGHPDLKKSNANKTILEEIEKLLPEAEIRKLDELYPDYQIDIAAEQAALEKADIIIFQYPVHWYSVPALLKVYIDKVMEHSWAYGSKGNALKGKFFIASMTVGGPEKEYQHDGKVTYTMDEFMAFIKRYTVTCKMEFKKLFCTYGANYIKGVYPEEKYTQVVTDCKKHAAELAEFVKTL